MTSIAPTFNRTKDIPDQIISLGYISHSDIEKQRDIVRKAYNKDLTLQDNYEAKHRTLAYMNLWNQHLTECNSRGRDSSLNSNYVIWEDNHQKQHNYKTPDTETALFIFH